MLKVIGALGWMAAAALACATPALAQDQGARTLRLLGEAMTPIQGGRPRFVLDLTVSKADEAFRSDVDGWFAVLSPGAGADQIQGSCVDARCGLSTDIEAGKLSISADLSGAGGTGRLLLADYDGRKIGESEVRLSPITGSIPEVGELAPPNAVGAVELADLLMWAGSPAGFGNVEDGPISWLQRTALATWQSSHERRPTGLVVTEELTLLRREAEAAKAAAGWTPVADPARGWSAAYPAKLLPRVTRNGAEQRFTSEDGSAVLVIAVDPPKDDAAFDAFVDEITEDRDSIENRSYTRVNDDLEITYHEKGRVFSSAYHNREHGFLRLEFSYPQGREADFGSFEAILPRSFRISDQLAAR